MSTTTATNGTGAAPRVRVVAEPLTYRQHGDHSYFRDFARYTTSGDLDGTATARLDRHAAEMRVEARANATATQPDGVRFGFERRTVTLDLGSGGYGTPPRWLIELTATAPRAERVIADLAPSYPLPLGAATVNVPRITTGTTVGVTAPASAAGDTDYADAATTSRCVLIAGDEDVPLQLLEQSPMGAAHLDQVIYRDLLAAYDAQLEAQMTSGTGGGGPTGQLLGLLNVPSIGSITYTSGSPTATALYPFFGQAFSAVSNTRKVRAEAWLMRGGRYAWLASGEDQQNRPLEVPLSAAAIVENPTMPNPIAGLLGTPVFTSEAISTTLGTGGNQDTIVAFRPSDLLHWQGTPTLSIFTDVLSGDLAVRISYRCYDAFIPGRYPSSIATITGTGMAVPTGY